MAWRLAESLRQFIRQCDLLAPARSRRSDGTIGDAAHAATTSDHNPRLIPGLGSTPVVTAADITHDPANGLDFGAVAEALRLSRDHRIKYVIFARQIFTSYAVPAADRAAWQWGPYAGDNPHDHHGHLSVFGADADNQHPWQIEDPMAISAEDPNWINLIWRVEALCTGRTHVAGGPRAGEPVEIVRVLAELGRRLAEIDAKVDAIAAPTVTVGAVVADAVVDELRDRLAD